MNSAGSPMRAGADGETERRSVSPGWFFVGAAAVVGGGIHHFFGTQRVGRHWWFLREFVRPREEEAALKAYCSTT